MALTNDTQPVPAYVQDIRAQPEALQRFLDAGMTSEVTGLLSRIDDFDRVVMTGMGASLFGQYPAFLRLAAAGKPVWLIETAELLGPARGLITARTLLWVTSQSGGSAEVEALLDRLDPRPAAVLAITNDPASPLGRGADAILELHCGVEQTVGTRSYINTLAAMALATGHALGEPPTRDVFAGPDALRNYLENWDRHLSTMDRLVPDSTTFVLGRGSSLAAAMTGALIIKEASGHPAEGMSVPQFRHGPLEMVGPHTTVVLLAGGPQSEPGNRVMEGDLRRFEARVVWLDTAPGADGAAMPKLESVDLRPIAEIVPLQLLSVVMAERAGHEPGAFRKIGKVTRTL